MNMALLHANIPVELKLKPNWVLHHKKIPMMALTVGPASSADRRTWCSYQDSVRMAAKRLPDGIGFMFEAPFTGIDLDHCVQNGKINDFAMDIIRKLDSYTEYSPSGTGVHIICKGALPAPIKTPTLEVYQTGRYFTVTGNRISRHSLLRQIDDFSFLYPAGYNKSKPLIERLNSVVDGSRNNTLAGIAGVLRRKGLTDEEMFEFLKPKAREVAMGEKELWTLCKSIGRYDVPNVSENGSSIEEFLKDKETVDWLVPGLIAKKSIGFVVGLPETGKTWMLIDLAIEVARSEGGLWLGRNTVNHGKVLFVDQERFKGETQRRFQAVLSAKDLCGADIKQQLFIRCGTATRLDLPPSFDAFHKELDEIRPDLVIIDSFATIKVAEENNRSEIQRVLEKVKELRNEFGCTFLFIHHESKAAFNTEESGPPSIAQMAGSVAIPAAAEMVLTVRKQGGASMVYNTKNTLSTTVAPFLVKVEDLNIDKSKIKVYTI
jgi:hypothetical protein